jgi:hypothetical protein
MATMKAGKRVNPWLAHVKKTMKQMKSKGTYEKGKGLSQVIKEAKKTWKKHGGADDSTTPVSADGPVETATAPATPEQKTGGRRRKTRRHSRK